MTKLLAGDQRIGLRERLVEDSITRAFERPLISVARASMLTGDVGETAVLARHNELERATVRLFHPVKFMLASAALDAADVARTMSGEFFIEDEYDGIRAQARTSAAGACGSSPARSTR
ncbi:MAG: hypothetical protein C4334_07185 [Pyrinomonas sp.]